MFFGKTLLVTGGTGSFGHAAIRRFIATGFSEIRVFSRDEKKQEDMRLSLRDKRLKFYIGDVRDYDAVNEAVSGSDYIFHAAALKQVPSCEFYPLEAVKTNVLGAENVLRAAIANGVMRCVVLSTDKAVYPVNAMGLSKALMEKVMVAKSRLAGSERTVVCATRYGNVIGSRGSVIPLFLDQIRQGRPLTITDPDMTRFLMSLDESVDLVLHTFEHAAPGDIFVHKAPSCTIGDLATALCELAGCNSPFQIIGTRHGEKLYETLVSREEMARAEDHGTYYRIPADTRDLNYDIYFTEGQREISSKVDFTSHNCERLSADGIKKLLTQLDIFRAPLSA